MDPVSPRENIFLFVPNIIGEKNVVRIRSQQALLSSRLRTNRFLGHLVLLHADSSGHVSVVLLDQ